MILRYTSASGITSFGTCISRSNGSDNKIVSTENPIENPQPDEKPLGETLKDLFSRPVLPEMTDVHLPLNLNIEEFMPGFARI